MLLVYLYIGFLLISQTEPYWNINSNEIDQYNPWNSQNRKLIHFECEIFSQSKFICAEVMENQAICQAFLKTPLFISHNNLYILRQM